MPGVTKENQTLMVAEGAQISIFAIKFVPGMNQDYEVRRSYTFIFYFIVFTSHYITDRIKKLELHLLLVLILLKIKTWDVQINVQNQYNDVQNQPQPASTPVDTKHKHHTSSLEPSSKIQNTNFNDVNDLELWRTKFYRTL